MAEIGTDADDDAMTLAVPHRETRVEESVNRAVRELAGRDRRTDDFADWVQEVGKRLAEVDPRTTAWRQ